MSNSLREKILNAQDIKTELVPVPVWGVEVEMRGLSAEQRAKVLSAPGVRREDGSVDDARLSVPVIIASAVDPETKEEVFTAADLEALGKKNADAVDKLAAVALRLSGLSHGAVEQIEKN